MSETPDQATINRLVQHLRPKPAPKAAESNGHTEAADQLSNTDVLENLFAEASARLAKTNHGAGVPTSPKRPLENATYLAESMLILAKIVDEHLTPKKRGRPRKTA